MKHVGKVAICLASGLVLQTGLPAVTADNSANPYAGIVDRNVFALKPAPPPPPPVDPNVTPPQKIILTGIVKAFGKKQVFFKTPPTGRPGEAAKEASFMLSEGERAGDIEVLEINEALGTIRVRNHGLEQPLSLEKDGMKPSSGGVAGAPGSIPLAPGAFPPVPGISVPRVGYSGGGGQGAGLTPVPTMSGGGGVGGGGSGASTVQRPLRIIPPQGQMQAQAQAQAQADAQERAHTATQSIDAQAIAIMYNADVHKKSATDGEPSPFPPLDDPPSPDPTPAGP